MALSLKIFAWACNEKPNAIGADSKLKIEDYELYWADMAIKAPGNVAKPLAKL
jgi:hypothetical protein